MCEKERERESQRKRQTDRGKEREKARVRQYIIALQERHKEYYGENIIKYNYS